MNRVLGVLILLALGAALAANAQVPDPTLPPGTQIPAAALPGPDFDVDKATDAYLALLTPEQRARSDAHFEGGYWVDFFGHLYAIAACLLILLAGWSTRIRDRAIKLTSARWLQPGVYGVGFIVLLWLLTLPISLYADYFREHHYGLSNLSFGGWLLDDVKNLLFNALSIAIVLIAIYAFLRRAQGAWVAWATAFVFVYQLFVSSVYPVFIAPAFNDFKPLPDGPVREAVLSLARANQIPSDNIAWFDASKQTTRISANVSGMFGTTQVSLNDNLLQKTSLPEIKAVMGHEMGHYVLHHGLRITLYTSLVIGFGFLVLDWLFNGWLGGFRRRHGVQDRADPAGVPLALAILIGYIYLVQPVNNHIVYVAEAEADMFGIDAAREPYGWATSAMRLSSYRKLDPGPVEEYVFYDHPSGRNRVRRAMLWLKENPTAVATPPAPRPAETPAPAN